MEIRILVMVLAVAFAVAVAFIVQRRRPAPPTNPASYTAPAQLDRADFPQPDLPWLVVLFSSATCDTCADIRGKVSLLGGDEVAVVDVEVGNRPDLHERYQIAAVPIVVIADAAGEVRRSFVGPVSATDLWGAMAELR